MTQIKDTQTGKIVKTSSSRKAAHNYCTKLNAKYGATRFVVAGIAA